MKRVVITGLGIVSCLGNNQDEVFKSLLNSKSGISFSEEYKEYNLKSKSMVNQISSLMIMLIESF